MTTLRQLQYFVTVAEEGHVTRAAIRLHISQPSLSKAIAQLETQLGVELLHRHGRGVELTSVGEVFLHKARAVTAAVADAELTAESFGHLAERTLDWGFIGAQPLLEARELFAAFISARPEVIVSFRELTYPLGSTAGWLDAVDVALLYSPTPDAHVRIEPLWDAQRVVLVARKHRLAVHDELTVSAVLDEVFCGTDPTLEPVQAGFWRLDDHRGRPGRMTDDRVRTPQELLAVVSSGRAIATAPASKTMTLQALIGGVVTIPLVDAHPTTLALAWRDDAPNPAVETLATVARTLAQENVDDELPHSTRLRE
jgi:DNA-binding transcriptional LysR family regulator